MASTFLYDDRRGWYVQLGWLDLAPVSNPDPIFYPVLDQRLISRWDHALPQLIHLIKNETSIKNLFLLGVIAHFFSGLRRLHVVIVHSVERLLL
jgi:hypothetical protein